MVKEEIIGDYRMRMYLPWKETKGNHFREETEEVQILEAEKDLSCSRIKTSVGEFSKQGGEGYKVGLESLRDLLHGTVEVTVEVSISFQEQWKPLQSFKSKRVINSFCFKNIIVP